MNLNHYVLTACISAVGLGLTACGTVDGSNDGSSAASSNGVFAPVAATPNAPTSIFPDPLANTGLATNNPVNPSLVPMPPVADTMSVSETLSGAVVFQPNSQPQQVQVRQAVPLFPPANPHQAAPGIDCSIPPTNVSIAIYTATCAHQASAMLKARETAMARGRSGAQFSPAGTSCASTPTSKAGLAAYRANCMGATTSPVLPPSSQQAVSDPRSTPRPQPPQPPAATAVPAAQPASQPTQATIAPTPTPTPQPAVTPQTQPPTPATQPAVEPSTSPQAPEPTSVAQPTSSSSSSSATSSIVDCDSDPTTGAELALFRAYCQ